MRTAASVLSLLLPGFACALDPGLQLFEQKIRPVLVEHCYSCHAEGAKKIRGGLRVDSRAALLKGGDSGPSLVPGNPKGSLLLQAMRGDGVSMPPKGLLDPAVIADFERWIKLGAPDPREGKVVAQAGIDLDKGRQFWSFQPPRLTTPPAVKDAAWPRSDIDRFLLAALEAKGVKPVRDADRAAFIRRVSLDLIGLPPTPDEVDAFVANPRPAELVDRLLASPQFGERWGRHWLDVARYADSNGKDENYVFHDAFRYRDYVIDSFNKDKPYNRFVLEQLAGDLLDAGSDEQLTGTGFLVVGPKVLADRDKTKRLMDVVDEQIDTVGKAFLGLTLGCARCHDHKFDPVPTQDYYALAGIFMSTRTIHGARENPVIADWSVRALGGAAAEKQLAEVRTHQKKLLDMANRIKKVKTDLKQVEDRSTMRVPSGLVGITVDDSEAKLVGMWKPSMFTKPYVGTGYVHDDRSGKGEKTATFTPKLPRAGEYEVFLSYTAVQGRASNVPVTVRHLDGEKVLSVDQQEKPKLDGLFRSLGKYRFEAGSKGSVVIGTRGTVGHVIVDAVRFVPAGALAGVPEMAMGVPEDVKAKLVAVQEELKKLEAEERQLKAAAPKAPPTVMAVRDEEQIVTARVNVRGNPHALGAEVPRGWLQVAARTPRLSSAVKQSGRLELAQWVASADNPLTARVMVNRVWQHLFGEGLVRTVDNFGVQGERPTHPELLDWLAVRFVQEGWSVKKLIRDIVLSRAYQLASDQDAALKKVDPENRLLGRANRRRLEVEAIRDSILAVSGKLDTTRGGSATTGLGDRAVTNDSKGGVAVDGNVRRSVYLPIIRNELPQVLEVFDFADPDVTTGRRDATTVPTQALFLLNSPFVLAQARATAKSLVAQPQDEGQRLKELYRRALGRLPTAAETRQTLAFLAEYRKSLSKDNDVEAWAAVCQAMFACAEFRFVE